MIESFANQQARRLFDGEQPKGFPSALVRAAQRKLQYLNAAKKLSDLRIPPGNRLEALRGDLRGFYSIRINDQFRIVFQWEQESAYEVEVLDYHKG
jgi:proteic killer suppression protein